jgi:hypothetical protein
MKEINKLSLLLLLLSFSTLTNCQSNNIEDRLKYYDIGEIPKEIIEKIEFYYLPWRYTGHDLTEENVRDYKNRTSRFTIEDSILIKEIESSLRIFDMGIDTSKYYVNSIHMVIDFHFKSGKVKTMCINRTGYIKYEGLYFYHNYYFMKLLLIHLPPADLERKE